jgi:hypothetical protein
MTGKDPRFLSGPYRANHRRLARERGPARLHQCVRCPAQAAEWAQVHTEDGSDPWADYVPMCRRCHVIYDRAGKPGHPQTPETRAKVSAHKKGWNPSAQTRARMSVGARTRTDRVRDGAGRFSCR